MTIIEVGITSQDQLTIVENEKKRKYDVLAKEMGSMHKCKTRIIPYVCLINVASCNIRHPLVQEDQLTVVENEKKKYDILANEMGLMRNCKTRIISYVLLWDGIVSVFHKSYAKEIRFKKKFNLTFKSIVLEKTLESISRRSSATWWRRAAAIQGGTAPALSVNHQSFTPPFETAVKRQTYEPLFISFQKYNRIDDRDGGDNHQSVTADRTSVVCEAARDKSGGAAVVAAPAAAGARYFYWVKGKIGLTPREM
ncbi:hypothetical protein ACJJTC_010503 [Scirpophaga incertulas]